MKRIISSAIAIFLLIPLLCCFSSAESDEYKTYKLSGINVERKSNYVVVYTPDFGATTKTTGSGYEACVGADGRVISVSDTADSNIPADGFVLSASGPRKTVVSDLSVGDFVQYDADEMSVLVLGKDYSPFSTHTFTYTGKNSARKENTLIIYDKGETTKTNTWGYEVCVDSNGTIISVGGNDNAIPEGGFVLSVIGTQKQALIDAARPGMSVSVEDTTKTVTVSYTADNALSSFVMQKDSVCRRIEESKSNFYLLDYEKLDRIVARLEEICTEIDTHLKSDNMLGFLKSSEYFETVMAIAESELIEYDPVEGRVLWLRISATSDESVISKTVKQIYEMGFNSVCIEALFDSTTIMPMPEDSLLEQNPAFAGKDMLKLYIDEFHRYGIEVHLWMTCYRVGYEGSTNTSRSVGYKKPEWRNVSQNGNTVVNNEYGNAFFLNPALPEVKEFLLETYEYLLKNYDFDGFQLDYVRYPENSTENFGYDDYTISEFKKIYGDIAIPTSSGQAKWEEWCKFRAEYVTQLVKSVGEMIKEIRPDVLFSCDVAPQYPETLAKMCQDSVRWMEEGIVDVIFPMAYGTVDAVTKWTGMTIEACDNKVISYIGLRDSGALSYREQIVASRVAGADGTAFFSYSQYTAGDYKGIIDTTIFEKNAVSPTYDTKKAVLEELKFFSKKATDLMIPSLESSTAPQSSVDALKQLVAETDAFCKKLEGSTITECMDEFGTLKQSADQYANGFLAVSMIIDGQDTAVVVLKTFHSLARMINQCRDDEKAAYRETHPLPEMIELPVRVEITDEFDNTDNDISNAPTVSTDESNDEKEELTVVEKVFQILFIAVMSLGIIGLPLFFVLNKRKNKIAKEYNGENVPEPKDTDYDNSDETDVSDKTENNKKQ